jgi:mRNA interferase MazF
LKRGEIWIAAGGRDYAGKPRPVVIIQNDRFDSNDSITVVPCTSDLTELPLFRIPLAPTTDNGLLVPTRVMADKLTTVARAKLGRRIGRLNDQEVARLNDAVLLFLGLIDTASSASA